MTTEPQPTYGPFVLTREQCCTALVRCRRARHRDEVEGRENPDVCKEAA